MRMIFTSAKQLFKQSTAAKAFLNVFIFFILPLKLAGLAFGSFEPIYLQLLPNYPDHLLITAKTLALLKASGQIVEIAFYVCLMVLSIFLTIAFNVFYNIDSQKIEGLRRVIGKSFLIKVVIFIAMIILFNYATNPMFKFIYEAFLYNSEAPFAGKITLYRAPEIWLRSITPAITFISALYPMVLVVFPWERKRKIEADTLTKVPLGFDAEAINEWIGPAAKRLAESKKWNQEDVVLEIKKHNFSLLADRSAVSKWYSGKTQMPNDVIGFFFMHGVTKFIK